MVEQHDVEQGTPEWHQLRAGKYTGSNAHKLLKYGAIDYALTASNKFKGNFWTKRGHILEDEAIELYEQIKQVTVSRPGFVTNSKYPNCGYSPDGLLPDLVIEVKSFSEPKHRQLLAGNIPLEIQAQVHYGLLICERPVAHLLAYNPNLDPALALKIIVIPAKRNISSNFRKILTAKEAQHAVYT